jgi:tetratricopeptide (TPR) repeat protein
MSKPQRGRTRQPSATPPASPVETTTTRQQAVALYESGMRALQSRQFQQAAEAFRSVLSRFPEEKELNDRVRTYLSVCERHLNAAPAPRTSDERLYAATIALNAGDTDTALLHLADIVAEDPDHDGALYMLGVVHALRDDAQTALHYLQRAILRNPANRSLALQDADLERLMQDESIRAALHAARRQQS